MTLGNYKCSASGFSATSDVNGRTADITLKHEGPTWADSWGGGVIHPSSTGGQAAYVPFHEWRCDVIGEFCHVTLCNV